MALIYHFCPPSRTDPAQLPYQRQGKTHARRWRTPCWHYQPARKDTEPQLPSTAMCVADLPPKKPPKEKTEMPKTYYLFWATVAGFGAILLLASGKGHIFTGVFP